MLLLPTLPFIASLAIALPNPRRICINPVPNLSPREQKQPPHCLYSNTTSSLSYATLLPSSNLTVSDIEEYFANFAFSCQASRANVQAHRLNSTDGCQDDLGTTTEAASATGAAAQPWFAAVVYTQPSECTTGLFQSLVGSAMRQGSPIWEGDVVCEEFVGSGDDGTGPNFESAAEEYFGGLA